MTEPTWLDSLKAGDSVFVSSSSFRGSSLSTTVVKKVLPTMIRLEGTDATYDKRGEEKGTFRWGHYSSHLVQDTQETRDAYEKQGLRSELSRVITIFSIERFNFGHLNKEQLVRLTKTLQEVKLELKPEKK
jgi:hypothetical protein